MMHRENGNRQTEQAGRLLRWRENDLLGSEGGCFEIHVKAISMINGQTG
jgi:hypothetical protein